MAKMVFYNLELNENQIDIVINALEVAWNTYNDKCANTSGMGDLENIIDYLECVRQKKYYLKHRFLNTEDYNYYFQDKYDGFLDDKYSYSQDEYKSKFTLKEIEEIKEKYNTDLKDFEIIEVEL